MKKSKIYFGIAFIAVTVLMTLKLIRENKEETQIIGYYNVENLFDVYDDPQKRDEDFTPQGKLEWTEAKYEAKLDNIAQVISEIAKDNGGQFHTILGLGEIENRAVLEDLVRETAIKKANYKIIHIEGPDRRGIDPALLYRPDQFKPKETISIPYNFDTKKVTFEMSMEEQAEFRTRDVLMVRGYIGKEHFAFYVAHLPSRYGGKGGDLRCRGAEIIYNHSMELMAQYPEIKIAVLGDMNDDPTDASISEYLRGKEHLVEVTEDDYFSPFTSMLKNGYGSLCYRGKWNIFDQILVNKNLLSDSNKGYVIKEVDNNYGVVFKKPFLLQQEGDYAGYPFRAFIRGQYVDGYSDHLPTYIILEK